jgi:ADP-ribose pyrophosphatase
MEPEKWRKESEDAVFQNRWIRVAVARLLLPTGYSYDYTVVRMAAPGVATVALNEQGEILLEREYRYPVDQVLFQLPGGLLDGHEEPLEAAQRELREETGYEADEWKLLGAVNDNPALSDGQTTLFLARGLRREGEPAREAAEFIALEWRSLEWLRSRIADGMVQDRLVIAALAFLHAHGELA